MPKKPKIGVTFHVDADDLTVEDITVDGQSMKRMVTDFEKRVDNLLFIGKAVVCFFLLTGSGVFVCSKIDKDPINVKKENKDRPEDALYIPER